MKKSKGNTKKEVEVKTTEIKKEPKIIIPLKYTLNKKNMKMC